MMFQNLKNTLLKTEKRLHRQIVSYSDLKDFLSWYGIDNQNTRTQSRVLSGIRAFYKFLLIEGEIDENPSSLIESPKIGLNCLKYYLLEEIDRMIDVLI